MKEYKSAASFLPGYLVELIENTPSSVAKLEAAWDGLNIETQIQLLHEIGNKPYYNFLLERIYLRAFKSGNSYVRYLAVQRLKYCFSEDNNQWKELKMEIEHDRCSLVRCSLSKKTHLKSKSIGANPIFGYPPCFFELPHEARLAEIRTACAGGKMFANLIRYAVETLLPSQKITEEELRDLILDYVGKHSFKEHYAKGKYMEEDYYDGYGEYSKGKDVEELWELIPVVPSSCAAVLIEELPISAGLSDDIPQNLLKNNLEEWQIELLFNRKDVDLENIRKAIFFDESKGDNVRCAAVCVNFNLSYEEFSKILSYEKEKKDKYLDLLDCANDLSLPIWNAVKEIRESEHIFGDIHTRQYYAGHIDNRFKELPDYSRREQILDLRLYTLAKEIVPWDKSTKRETLSDDLSFLSEGVKDNTWQTFLNFRKIWRENRHSSKDERLLSQYEAFSYQEQKETDITAKKIEEVQAKLYLLNRKINATMKFIGDSNDVQIMTLWGIPAGGVCYLITKDVVFAAIFTVIAMHIIYVFYKHKVLKNSLSREKEIRDRLRENYTTEELSSLDIDEELR